MFTVYSFTTQQYYKYGHHHFIINSLNPIAFTAFNLLCLSLSISLQNKHKPMSRHRRQASLVLPPELIAGNEPAKPSDVGQATAGALAGGHGASTGAGASVSTQRSTDPLTANQEQYSSTHCQDTPKKPPAQKPAWKAEDHCSSNPPSCILSSALDLSCWIILLNLVFAFFFFFQCCCLRLLLICPPLSFVEFPLSLSQKKKEKIGGKVTEETSCHQ